MVISLTSCMGFNRNGSPGEKGGERLKIYTKTGDAGETGLFGGGRTPKDSPRVAAYGEVDELNAALGVARALGRAAIGDSGVAALEQAIDEQESRLEPLKHFILPGGTPQAAALHLSRTVCRRAAPRRQRRARPGGTRCGSGAAPRPGAS